MITSRIFFTPISTIKPVWSNILKNSRFLLGYLRLVLRTILFLLVLSTMVLFSMLLRIIIIFTGKWRYIQINTKYIIRGTANILLRILGVKISKPRDQNLLDSIIVANHWGYIDSLILMAASPCLIMSNMDVRKIPVVGKIMKLMGFVFVDRSRNRSIPDIMKDTTDIINFTNLNFGFFPEGKTGDGLNLGKFNSSFFELANTTKRNVVPIVIRIESINKKIPNQENINQVVYHNSSGNIVKHLLQLLQLRSIEISFIALPQISSSDISLNKYSRKDICKIAEERISNYIDNKFCINLNIESY